MEVTPHIPVAFDPAGSPDESGHGLGWNSGVWAAHTNVPHEVHSWVGITRWYRKAWRICPCRMVVTPHTHVTHSCNAAGLHLQLPIDSRLLQCAGQLQCCSHAARAQKLFLQA